MAWNESGNGKKDPWGSGGGNQPPDLDEVFRKLQARLKGLFGGSDGSAGGSTGGSSGIGWLIVLALVAWGAFDATYIINEPERGVVLRFGKYVNTMQPGLNFTLPRPVDYVYKVDVQQVRSESLQAMMLTKDENIVQLNIAVQFRVKDAQDFLFNVRDPIQTLEQAAESAMRQVVGDHDMDFVLLEGRAEMRADITTTLQGILDFYGTGLELTTVNLEDVRPPRQVKEAFDDAIKAREDKERSQNIASAYANGVVPKARGKASRILQEAEGYKASTIARATGESQRFTLLLEEYLKAPGVTRQRLYLETMETVLGDTSKVLLDVEQGNNVLYLPLDQLMRNTAPALQRSQDSARRNDSYSSEGGRAARETSRSNRGGSK